jgi:hypothetical protein
LAVTRQPITKILNPWSALVEEAQQIDCVAREDKLRDKICSNGEQNPKGAKRPRNFSAPRTTWSHFILPINNFVE